MKRIVIAGTRDFSNYDVERVFIDACVAEFINDNVIILSGCCKGADKLGETYAEEHGLDIESYPAQWKQYGKRAGVVRNRKMVEAADFIICFWDGKSKGTKNMIECAKRLNKPIKIMMIS